MIDVYTSSNGNIISIRKRCHRMKAYQIKITINSSSPPIWRRCIIPAGLTFSQLTVVLNTIMGWPRNDQSYFYSDEPCVLFMEGGHKYNPTEGDYELPAEDTCINTYLENGFCSYTYIHNIHAEWRHKLALEKVLTDYDKNYPLVIKATGDCPPLECGHISVYNALLNPKKLKKDMADIAKAYADGKFAATPYDLEAVNAMLEKTCTVNAKKVDRRFSSEIYDDWEAGNFGLYTKNTKERTRREKAVAREYEAFLNDDDDYLDDDYLDDDYLHDLADWEKTDNVPLYPREFSLKKSLELFDKDSLKHIAKTKHLQFKSNDKKAVLVEKIHAYIADPHVMEAYFITMDDMEMDAFKSALDSKETARQMTDDDFPLLSVGIYANYAEDYGIEIPTEVKEAFSALDKKELQKKRKRRLWLLQCLNTANLLYGIVPMDNLAKLYNRHRKYRISADELRHELESIPPDICLGELHDDTYYLGGLWPDDRTLLQSQGDTPFYLPSEEEIQDLYEDPLASAPFLGDLIEFFISHMPDMDENILRGLLITVHTLFMSDCPVEPIIQQLKHLHIILSEKEETITLPNLLKKCSYETRKITNRGYTDKEREEKADAQAQPRSNLIEVKNWRRGK